MALNVANLWLLNFLFLGILENTEVTNMKDSVLPVLFCIMIVSATSSDIRCPTGVKRFGAFPGTNIQDASYFY